jgi:hypothetical protein
MEPKIIISNYRPINKNTLQGTFDLKFRAMNLIIKGCMWHITNGRDWIAFPSKEYTQNGERKYQNILDWGDRDTADRFYAAVVPLVKSAAGIE